MNRRKFLKWSGLSFLGSLFPLNIIKNSFVQKIYLCKEESYIVSSLPTKPNKLTLKLLDELIDQCQPPSYIRINEDIANKLSKRKYQDERK